MQKIAKIMCIAVALFSGCDQATRVFKNLEKTEKPNPTSPSIDLNTYENSQQCVMENETYKIGEEVPALDNCNSCRCEEGGQIICTEMECERTQKPVGPISPDPGNTGNIGCLTKSEFYAALAGSWMTDSTEYSAVKLSRGGGQNEIVEQEGFIVEFIPINKTKPTIFDFFHDGFTSCIKSENTYQALQLPPHALCNVTLRIVLKTDRNGGLEYRVEKCSNTAIKELNLKFGIFK